MRQYRIEQIQSIKDFRNQRKTTEFQVWKLIISIVICQSVVFVASWYTAKSISTWYETLKKTSIYSFDGDSWSYLDHSLRAYGNCPLPYLEEKWY
jgi:hypothetical protein